MLTILCAIRLREAAQKYEERESRQEDIENIRDLNKTVDQHRSQINSLQVSKSLLQKHVKLNWHRVGTIGILST
jgi:hypothetical protein